MRSTLDDCQGPKLPETDLATRFSEFNHAFFGDRLPQLRIALTNRLGRNSGGRCDLRRKVILINANSDLDPRFVLIHEMSHASVGPGHGYVFHLEIERLMSMGAPVMPSLFAQPRWLERLPLCREWARKKNLPRLCLRDGPNPSWSDLALEFEDSVIMDGARTFPDAVICALRRNGDWEILQEIEDGSFETFYQKDEVRAARRGFRSALAWVKANEAGG